jgi:hypothetical protein
MPVGLRRWFQIHLSTAVLLMFVAAGLLSASLRPVFKEKRFLRTCRYGWPLEAHQTPNPNRLIRAPQLVTLDSEEATISVGQILDIEPPWNYRALTIDVLVAIGVLITFAALSEWRIRRHERGRLQQRRRT